MSYTLIHFLPDMQLLCFTTGGVSKYLFMMPQEIINNREGTNEKQFLTINISKVSTCIIAL